MFYSKNILNFTIKIDTKIVKKNTKKIIKFKIKKLAIKF